MIIQRNRLVLTSQSAWAAAPSLLIPTRLRTTAARQISGSRIAWKHSNSTAAKAPSSQSFGPLLLARKKEVMLA
jgi:hypothetical protein